jgi:hypothetical protein
VADDLKPPASASAESQAAAPALLAGAAGTGARRAESGPAHRYRFGIAYFALAAVVGAAVGTLILLLGRPADTTVEWSSWQPTTEGGFRINEIASHVAGRYRLDETHQLLVAIPGPPSIDNGEGRIPISGVAMRAPIVRSSEDFSFISTDNGLMYLLCGGGTPRCSLEGQSSNQRGRLVRREALELALYTFKYVDGIESVLAFMPPASGSEDTHALFFRRSDLAPQLERPLNQTLRLRPSLRPASLDPIEGGVVDRLTLPHLFRTEPTQAQDGSVILVLDPAALGG